MIPSTSPAPIINLEAVRRTLDAAETIDPAPMVTTPNTHEVRRKSAPKVEQEPPTTEPRRTLEELLFHIPWLSRNAANAWERHFAKSIAEKARLPRWRPTEKQIQVMQRLVANMFGENNQEAEVIEQ